MAVLWEMSQRATQFCKAVVSPRQAQCSAGDAHEVGDALLLGGRRVAVLSGAIGRFGHDCRRVQVRRDVGVNRQRGTCRFFAIFGQRNADLPEPVLAPYRDRQVSRKRSVRLAALTWSEEPDGGH